MKRPLLIRPPRLVSRRALLAAPAIIAVSRADAQFWIGRTFTGDGTIQGQIKPTGTPTYVGNASFPGMLFYAFDTGTGVYSIPLDCTPGHNFDPTTYWSGMANYAPGSPPYDPKQSLVSAGSTSFGTANLWPGASLDSQTPGGGALVGTAGGMASNDAMRAAINLTAQGVGACFTMFTTFMQQGNTGAGGGWIAGRGCWLDGLIFINGFTVGAGSDNTVSFNWSSADVHHGTPQIITSSVPHSNNTIHTAVVQCVNQDNSGSNTTVTLYLDGVQVGQATGQTISDVSDGNSDAEDQFQFGTGFHVGAGQSFQTFNGPVFQSGIATSAWTMPTAAASLTANPYQMLKL